MVLRCPQCGLSITPRFTSIAPEHCPRCLARRGVLVAFEPGLEPAAGAARSARRRFELITNPERESETVGLKTLLATVAELGAASAGLVAWELSVEEDAVSEAWATAMRARLLRRDRFDHSAQEWLYRLTAAGREQLRAFERTR